MTARTPTGGSLNGNDGSRRVTRSQTAAERAETLGALPVGALLPDFDAAQFEQFESNGGEGNATSLLNMDDMQRVGFNLGGNAPIDNLRDMTVEHGPSSHQSIQSVAETLTRLQLDIVRKNSEEMNKMKQMMKEEMRIAMRGMQEQIRELVRPRQSMPRQDERPYVRQPSSQPNSRGRNGESNRSNQSYGPDTTRRRENILKIDKWGIKFDGDLSKMSVDDFIFRVEHLKAYHGVSWSEVIGDFHKLLGSKASEWYWIQVRMNGISDWDTLRNLLRRTYSSRLTNFEIERELMERMQRHGESIDDYIHEMNRLIRAQLRAPIAESEMVKVLKRNVREAVGKILFPMQITSVEKLRSEYHAIEKAFMKNHQNRGYVPTPVQRQYVRPQVNEIIRDESLNTAWKNLDIQAVDAVQS